MFNNHKAFNEEKKNDNINIIVTSTDDTNTHPQEEYIDKVVKNSDNSTNKEVEAIKSNSFNTTTNIKNIQNESSYHVKLQYRPDIDGLRAFAIILVVIFHAWPKYLKGGFIGVDVFFVISGYLISSIILREIQNKKFSFITFYQRRVRRLFPALIVMLIATLIIGNAKLSYIHYKSLLETLIASCLFSANLYFLLLNDGDYFNNDTKRNPLLHLWSLGIEEQFYILWPVLAMILMKIKNTNTKIFFLFCLIVMSFGINIFGVYTEIKYSFYFPFSRFWQLIVGCVLAFYELNSTEVVNKILAF